MKVMVTGAAGYIGRHVVQELLENGHTVYAVDVRHEGISPLAHLLDVNIFDSDSTIYEQSHCPDLCIHLAWQDGFIHNSPRHIENLSKHFSFLRNLANGGCKRIAVMGTMHEIGFWEGAIDENTPCNPMSMYGIAKNALRQSLIQLFQGTDVNLYWLRAFYIIGDDTKNNSIFTKILSASVEGKTEFPFTTGTNQYDFITIAELAHQIVMASTQDETTGIINVCTGKPVALKDKVESFIEEKNLNIKLKYGAFPDRPYDSKIVYGNADKINAILAKFQQ